MIPTQKTPMLLYEQKGGLSGLTMQYMPWSCQLMKKMMNRWCEYQKRSKLALRLFSIAYQTMAHKQATIIQPVIPGPVAAEEVCQNLAWMRYDIPDALWAELKDHGLISADAPTPPS